MGDKRGILSLFSSLARYNLGDGLFVNWKEKFNFILREIQEAQDLDQFCIDDAEQFMRSIRRIVKRNRRVYFGVTFYKDEKGYWIATRRKYPHAHRWVWENVNGPIPEGMDVHHKDEDKSNNEIENLELLDRSNHLKRHWETPGLREKRRGQLDIIRPKVIAWLRSKEGRKKQSEDAKRAWKKRKKFIVYCNECYSKIETTQPWTKFCSASCDHRFRKGLKKIQG